MEVGSQRVSHAEVGEWNCSWLPSLHLMGSAFAVENVSWLTAAFAFAPLRLFVAADVGADLIAAENLLFGCCDSVFQNFSHFFGFLGGVLGIGLRMDLS